MRRCCNPIQQSQISARAYALAVCHLILIKFPLPNRLEQSLPRRFTYANLAAVLV